jgi:hypothetical protein
LVEPYARIRDDDESRRKFAEIKLRACVKIGEISRELERAEAHGGKICLPTDGKSKEQQLKEAGISTSTANRYEELVGESVEIGMQAADEYFANASAMWPPMAKWLRKNNSLRSPVFPPQPPTDMRSWYKKRSKSVCKPLKTPRRATLFRWALPPLSPEERRKRELEELARLRAEWRGHKL